MKDSVYDRLLGFLSELDDLRIAYSLGHHRPEAITVTLVLPGQRCEVEFLDDGSVDVERFVSSGELGGEELLSELLAAHAG